MSAKLKQSQIHETELNRELENIKNGLSFRVGRAITWLLRKIKDFAD